MEIMASLLSHHTTPGPAGLPLLVEEGKTRSVRGGVYREDRTTRCDSVPRTLGSHSSPDVLILPFEIGIIFEIEIHADSTSMLIGDHSIFYHRIEVHK